MFKVKNRNTRTICEICSKLTIKTPEKGQYRLGIRYKVTIAGEEWLNNYLKNLDDALTNQVEVNPRSRIFKFGDRRKVIAISSVKIPAQIGEKKLLKS